MGHPSLHGTAAIPRPAWELNDLKRIPNGISYGASPPQATRAVQQPHGSPDGRVHDEAVDPPEEAPTLPTTLAGYVSLVCLSSRAHQATSADPSTIFRVTRG